VTDLPAGYLQRIPPTSVQQVINRISADKIKNRTKNAVADYIARFFDSNGIARAILESVSASSLQYVTDKSLPPGADPSLKRVFLARMFNEIRQHPISFLIVDQGMQYVPDTLGLTTRQSQINGKLQTHYTVYRKIALSLMIVSMDEETTDTLVGVLSMMFGELKNEAGGSYINPPRSSWVVRLPLSFTIGTTTGQQVEGDPKDSFWWCDLQLEIDYEDVVMIDHTVPESGEPDPVVNDTAWRAPEIDVPETLSVGQRVPIHVHYWQDHYEIGFSDPQIASYSTESWMLTARKAGTFFLWVIDPNRPPALRKIAEKQISVSLW
jgi:hypothetical protein